MVASTKVLRVGREGLIVNEQLKEMTKETYKKLCSRKETHMALMAVSRDCCKAQSRLSN